jgi:hypothetical protein
MAELPPPKPLANASANARLAGDYNVSEGPPVRIAAQAYFRRCAVEHMKAAGKATVDEIGEAIVFEYRAAAAAAAAADAVASAGAVAAVAPPLGPAVVAVHPDAPPAWAAGLLAAVHNMNLTLNNVVARQQNSVLGGYDEVQLEDDPLGAVGNAAGIVAANFPATLRDLHAMGESALTALLVHYGLSYEGPMELRRNRFKKFIGIPSIRPGL